MKTWKYIIFDMDGTLFDSERISQKSWFAIKDYFHYPITEEFTLKLMGRTRQSAQPIFQEYMPEDFDQEAVFAFHKNFIQAYKEKHGPLPKTDLDALFQSLQNKGYRLALCSSSKQDVIDFNLNYGNWKPYFDVIVNGEMANRGKPFPDLYIKTAELLNANVNECLVIEDSYNGIVSGHEAGMDVIMALDLTKPDDYLTSICYAIIDDLNELLDIV